MADDEKQKERAAIVRAGNRGLTTRSATLVLRGLNSLPLAKPRVLQFPKDRSMGKLFVYHENNCVELIEARGEITVGSEFSLSLRVSADEADLSPLAEMGSNNLQELDLSAPHVSDLDMKYIENLVGLTELNLSRRRVTDTGLMHISEMAKLRKLDLFGTFALSLSYLKKMAKLEDLNLKYCDVTDDGLSNIQHISSLRELNLGGTPITDRGLEYLRSLTSLSRLVIRETNTTPEGIALLRNALPDCSIV